MQAVTEKANYINRMNLGGAMFWAIDNDDFDNVCGDGRYPLISKVYNMIVDQNRIDNIVNLGSVASGIQGLMPNFTFL